MAQAEIACHYLYNGSKEQGERAESQQKGNFAVYHYKVASKFVKRLTA